MTKHDNSEFYINHVRHVSGLDFQRFINTLSRFLFITHKGLLFHPRCKKEHCSTMQHYPILRKYSWYGGRDNIRRWPVTLWIEVTTPGDDWKWKQTVSLIPKHRRTRYAYAWRFRRWAASKDVMWSCIV